MDDTNNNSFNLNTNPSDPTPTPPATDPLNTGNGLENSLEMPAASTAAPTDDPQPHEIALGNLEVNTATAAPVVMAAEPMPPESPAMPEPPVMEIPKAPEPEMNNPEPVVPNPESNVRKYLIIATVGILIVTGGVLAYFFYFADSGAETEETENETLNTLSGDNEDAEVSPEMEELEDVVEDLKDVYSEENSSTAPPSITIDLSEESEIDTKQTPKKIAR